MDVSRRSLKNKGSQKGEGTKRAKLAWKKNPDILAHAFGIRSVFTSQHKKNGRKGLTMT